MSEIKDKLKEVKDKVLGAGEDAKDTVTGHDEDRIYYRSWTKRRSSNII